MLKTSLTTVVCVGLVACSSAATVEADASPEADLPSVLADVQAPPGDSVQPLEDVDSAAADLPSADVAVPPDADIQPDSGPVDAAEPDVAVDVPAPGDVFAPPPPFEPAPVTYHRLRASQYRATIKDLLGLTLETQLEADTSLHGFVAVAASELTIPPLAAEQYEAAAWEAGGAILADEATRRAMLGCEPTDAICFRSWVARFGLRAWRRPLSSEELDHVVAIAETVQEQLAGDPWRKVEGAIALFLQSPHFLFRVEAGESLPGQPAWRRYTDYEMAARVSYLLWGTTPDDALLAAADEGLLTTDAGLLAQAERLLADPRARDTLGEFFAEFIGLDKLAAVTKDPELYPNVDDALKAAARREVTSLFDEVVFDLRADFRELLTTDATYVDDRLAELYGLAPVGDGAWVRTTLPPGQERGGIQGRIAVLMTYAHARVTSPTLRGRFVRERLLCQDIPPPPAGVVTELPGDDGEPKTLREKLEEHRENPFCAGCHDLMDPIGFTFEFFGPLGERRELDSGLAIDASGVLDGALVDGADELAQALAEHPDLPGCVARRLYRHATGHLESLAERVAQDALGLDFVASGYRFDELLLALILSEGFRYAIAPAADLCDDEGGVRTCTTACGAGIEICADGQWGRCNALTSGAERCNGVDDDCDGETDEGVERACFGTCAPGIATCAAGSWGECVEAAAPLETCNGIDDDCDGETDEGLDVEVVTSPFGVLTAQHASCDGVAQIYGNGCNAAVNRACGAQECSATGFGPFAVGGGEASYTCLAQDQVIVHEVPYATLAAQHASCNAQPEYAGPNCSAAIKRYCQSLGEGPGFGPLEHSADVASVACTPQATSIQATYTQLVQHHPSCSQNGERWGPACATAIHGFCVSQGYASGYGPVENHLDNAHVVCLGGMQ